MSIFPKSSPSLPSCMSHNLRELVRRAKEIDEGKATFVVKTMDELIAMEK